MFPIAAFDELPFLNPSSSDIKNVKFELKTNMRNRIVFKKDISIKDAMNPDSIYEIYKDFLLTDEKGKEYAKSHKTNLDGIKRNRGNLTFAHGIKDYHTIMDNLYSDNPPETIDVAQKQIEKVLEILKQDSL